MATQDVKIRITALDKTSGALRNIGGALRTLTKPLFNLKTALAGVVGVGGMALLVKQSLSAIDALAKTSSRIGTTTEALSKLQYAASLAGVETNTLNMAMQRFVRRTAEAANGTGEAVSAFRRLRLNADELQKLPLDERMKALAEAFKGLRSEEEKLAVAFKLFDSEGTAVVNMLRQTGAEMDAVFAEAEKLGLVMSEETAQGVEDANDAITRMRGLFRGFVLQITGALAPALESLVKHLTNLKIEFFDGKGGVEGFAKAIATDFITAARNMIVAIANIHTSIQNLIYDVQLMMFDFRQFFGLDGLSDAEREIKQRMLDISMALGAIDKFGEEKAGRAVATLKALGLPTVEEARAELAKLVAENEIIMERLQRPIRPEAPDYSGWLAEFDRIIAGIREKKDEVASTMEEVTTVASAPWYMPFINGIKMFSGSLDEIVNEKLPDLKQQMDAFTLQTINNFTQALVDGVTGAKKFGEAIRNLAKSVVDSLIKMLVQYYLTEPLFRALTGGISSFFDGGSFTKGFSENFKTRDKLAVGGPVQSGSPYLVGERGPELFVPNASGGIVPNDKLGGGGVTVVQHINVTTGVQQTVRAEIANLLPQISNAAKAAVADSRMRGGGFSKAMVGA